VPVIEVAGLRRSYRSRTGVLRRTTREVEAVRGIDFEVGQEAAVGMLYVAIGTMLLRFFEAESRRRATLHTA
jgi:hypothetical protein